MIYILCKDSKEIITVMTEWDFWEEYHDEYLSGELEKMGIIVERY